MREILNSTHQRQLSFLEILFIDEGWLTIGQIAERLDCSEKILRNDIAIINDLFAPFHIEVSVKKGVTLLYPDNYSFDYLYTVILKNSPEFNFLETIFFDETLSSDKYIETSFISPSTLHRIVKKINRVFLAMDIQVQTAPFKLVGNEDTIRNFFTFYFLERYPIHPPFLNDVQNMRLNHLLKYVTNNTDIDLNYPDFKRIKSLLLTSIVRYTNRHPLILSKLSDNRLLVLKSLLMNYTDHEEFERAFHLHLDEHLAVDLFSIFLKNDYAPTLTRFKAMLEKNKEASETATYIKLFLSSLSNALNIEVQNEETLIFELYNLQLFSFGQDYILFDRKKNFARRASAEFPFFIKVLESELPKLHYYDSFEWTEQSFNDILYTITVHWTGLVYALEKSLEPITIGIFCDSDMEHSKFLSELIDFHFHEHVKTVILTSLHLDTMRLEQATTSCDLIVTSISGINFGASKTICIGTMPNMRNWRSIQKAIFDITKNQGMITTKFIDSSKQKNND